MCYPLLRYRINILYIIGDISQGEAWTVGEKVPRQRWPEYVQVEEEDGSDASTGMETSV